MKKFNLEIFDGHPIIQDGENRILIDTGAPSTIHVADNISFGGELFSCSENYMGLTAASLSEHLGTKITTLLGTDILSEFRILFDYRNLEVSFSKGEIQLGGEQFELSNFMGIPIIELLVGNQRKKFFLDSGAKLSYLSQSVTNSYTSVGKEEDFYPGVGKFETDCFDIPTRLGEVEFVARYGNLPSLLQMTLMLGGTDGVIGYDFFSNFRVLLDLRGNNLIAVN